MPAFRSHDGRYAVEDTRVPDATDACVTVPQAPDWRALIDADPVVREARATFPDAMAAAEAGAWEDCERLVVREVMSYMTAGTAEMDLQLSGLYEWGGASGGGTNQALGLDLSQAERQQYVGMGRMLAKASPPVHNALRLGTSYVIGQGIPKPTSADADVQAVIDDLWSDPDNDEVTTHEGQKETDRSQRLAGELFMAVHVNPADGHCKWRSVEPLRVVDIVPHPDDARRRLYYRVELKREVYNFATGQAYPAGLGAGDTGDHAVTNATSATPQHGSAGSVGATSPATPAYVYYPDWSNIAPPAGSDQPDRDPYRGGRNGGPDGDVLAPGGAVMAHFPLNRIGGLRGVPDMAAAVTWVVEHKRFMDARVMIMHALSKIAMIKTVKGGPNQVAALAASERSSLTAFAGGGSAGFERQPMPVATTAVKNDAIAYDFPTFDTGAGNAVHDLEALAQMVGTAFGLPTHYILMSTETNRLATAVAMELPVLKMYEDRQSSWRDLLRQLIDYALIQAAKAGRIKAPVLWRHGHEMIDWDSAAPAPESVTVQGVVITSAPGSDAATDTSPVREGLAEPDVRAQAATHHAAATPAKQREQNKQRRGTVNIDLPGILARDVPAMAGAINTLAQGGYMTPEDAAYEAYLLFAPDDLDSKMDQWRAWVDTQSAQIEERQKQQQALEQQQSAPKQQQPDQHGQMVPAQTATLHADARATDANLGGTPSVTPSGGMSR